MCIRDRLWVGGSRGIRALNRRTGRWTGYLSRVIAPKSFPLCLTANDSLLWIGTDRGLVALNYRKNSWIRYGTAQGLPAERIQTLVLEADTLWIGTPGGLTRFIWNRPQRDVF